MAFDTSAAHCAAALLLPNDAGEAKALNRVEEMQKGQAERLVPLLEELLAEAGLGWGQIGAIGVGIGPGNFTGVRIAVAAARGLALGLAIPAIGVTRLDALAHGLPRPLRVIEDARRDMVYLQDFAAEGRETTPQLVAIHDVVPVDYPATGSAAGPDAAAAIMPLAEAIAHITATRMQDPNQPRPAPYYLRAADAAPPADPPPVILDAIGS